MTPEQIRDKKNNFFATMEKVEHVIDLYTLEGIDVAILMIAINTVLETLAQEAEKLEVSDE